MVSYEEEIAALFPSATRLVIGGGVRRYVTNRASVFIKLEVRSNITSVSMSEKFASSDGARWIHIQGYDTRLDISITVSSRLDCTDACRMP